MFILHDFFHLLSKHWIKLSLLCAIAIWSVILAWPGDRLQIIFCNAGQGDETLVQYGFSQVLIDSSRPGRALDCLSTHMPFFDRTINALVITHPQLDHFGGAEDVVDRYKLMRYVYNGFGSESSEWAQLSKKLSEKKVPISVVSAGDKITMGGVEFRVLWPETRGPAAHYPSPTSSRSDAAGARPGSPCASPLCQKSSVLGIHSSRDPNRDAIVLGMSYEKFRALFTADIGEEEEKEIINGYNLYNDYNDDKNYQILKVAHHGSKTSSSKEFLDVIKPLLAVIEVGKNNYGHPTKEAVDRLKSVGATIFRTDQDGDVVVETDGKKWAYKKTRNPNSEIRNNQTKTLE